MKHYIFLPLAVLLFNITAQAQIQAITEYNQKVVINEDGTWTAKSYDSLTVQYDSAFSYAQNIMSIPSEDATKWAEEYVQDFAELSKDSSLACQFNECLFYAKGKLKLEEKEAYKWAEKYAEKSSKTFQGNKSISQMHDEVFAYAQLKFDLDAAQEIIWTQNFVAKYAKLSVTKTLSEQYDEAYGYAKDKLKLHPLQSKDWTLTFMDMHAKISEIKLLHEEFEEAMQVAEDKLGFSNADAKIWSSIFLAANGHHPKVKKKK